MNRIYKVIWSRIRNCYVVVSEIAKRQTKGGNRFTSAGVRGALAGAVVLSLTAGVCSPVWAGGVDGGTVAGGIQASTAIGGGSKIEGNGHASFAAGVNAYVNALAGIAVGADSSTTAGYGISIGRMTVASGQQSIAIGSGTGDDDGAHATGLHAVAIGSGSTASQASTALGSGVTALAWNSTAVGNSSSIGNYANNAIAIGGGIIADGSATQNANSAIAIGYQSQVSNSGTSAVAIGASASASASGAVAIGNGSTATEANVVSFGNNTTKRRLVNVAAGTADNDAVNVAQLNAGLNGVYNSPSMRYFWGSNGNTANGSGNNSLAVGQDAQAWGDYNAAFGASSHVTGQNQTAVGQGSTISGGSNNTAIGQASGTGNGSNNTAIGHNTQVYGGTSNTAVGEGSYTSFGDGNTAIGQGSRASGGYSIALGYQSQASDNSTHSGGNNIAVGTTSRTSASFNNIAIGPDSISGGGTAFDQMGSPTVDPTTGGTLEQGSWRRALSDRVGTYYPSIGKDPGAELGRLQLPTWEGGAGLSRFEAVKEMEFQVWLNDPHFATDRPWEGTQFTADYSTALGAGARAAGRGETAIGGGAWATGGHSTAVGVGARASGLVSTAVGQSSRAETPGAIAIGERASVLDTEWSHHIPDEHGGDDWDLPATNAIAIGSEARATARDTTTVGRYSQALMPTSTAYGNNSHANGQVSIAIGNKATAGYEADIFNLTPERDAAGNPVIDSDGKYVYKIDSVKDPMAGDSSIAMGNRATSVQRNDIAIGTSSYTDGRDSVTVGVQARATGKNSIAIGGGEAMYQILDARNLPEVGNPHTEGARYYGLATTNQAAGDYSMTAGYNNATVGEASSALGKENEVSGTGSLAAGTGNRIGTVQFEVPKSKVVLPDGTETEVSLVPYGYEGGEDQYEKDAAAGKIKGLVKTKMVKVIVDGEETEVEVLDQENTVTGYAVGTDNTIMGAEETFAGAFGYMNQVSGDNGYALGNKNITTSKNSIALGINNKIGQLQHYEKPAEGSGELDLSEFYKGDTEAEGSMAFGNDNTIHGKQSIAVGTGHVINGNNSGAFGDPTIINANDSYSIGNNNTIGGTAVDDDVPEGSNTFVMGNNVATTEEGTVVVGHHSKDNDHTFGENSVSLGFDAVAKIDNSVALGSYSVATRTEGNGVQGSKGSRAGFDVRTGTYYNETGKEGPTWTSTLAAVSVGGDSADGAIGGKAAEQTRQITGVAAGTSDTDAVNVAQLKLAQVELFAGDNVEIIKDTSSGHAVYTIHSLNAIVAAGENITVEGNPGDAAGNNGRTTDPDGNPITGNTTAGGAGDNGTAGGTGDNGTAGSAGGTATPSNKPIEPEENHHTTKYIVSTGKTVVEGGDGIEVTSETDKEKNITTYTVNSTTHYSISSEDGDKSVVNKYTITGTNGDKLDFEDTDTTYKVKTKRDIKTGTVAATTTITDSNGNTVGEFQDTHNGLTGDSYEVNYKDGKGTVTIKDKDGNEATITGIRDTETINNLGDQITRLDTKIEKVGAGAAALAGLHPLDFDPDEKWDFAASLGSYKSEQAVAIGAFYRPNEDTMFSIGGTVGNGNNMINVGVSWKFGQKNRISANRISSAKEIIELRKNQENVHSFLADAVAGNQLDLSKIQLFPDVEENHWAYDYVATMAGNGVLEGYPDGYFKGNRNMTRYEMAAVLYRLMQNGARLSDKALTEFAPELDRIRVDTITQHKDGTPHIQRVRTIKERVEEKADPVQKEEKIAREKAAKEQLAREKAEEKAAKEQLAREKAEEKAAKEQLAKEKKAEEKAAKERLAQEKKAQEKAAKEQAAKEKAEAKAAKAKATEKPAE